MDDKGSLRIGHKVDQVSGNRSYGRPIGVIIKQNLQKERWERNGKVKEVESNGSGSRKVRCH